MTFTRQRMAAALLAACFAGPACAAGDPPAPPAEPQGPPQHGPEHHGPEDGMDMPFDGMHGGMGGMGGMIGLHRLNLSEAQQDKLFALHHAAEPDMREHMKAIRRAHEALAELGRADRFDDARAGALARELGQAVAAAALQHARLEAQALAVLTPEQRAQLRDEQRDPLRRHRTPGPQLAPGQMQHPQGMPDAQAPQRRPE